MGVALYLGFGWVGLYAVSVLGLRYGLRFIQLLVWGAAAYTAGALIEYMRWPRILPRIVGSHELFHLFVLVGVGCHWRFVWKCASGVSVPEPAIPTVPPTANDECVPEPYADSRPRAE
jgi:channel protein (hemolysin III family)